MLLSLQKNKAAVNFDHQKKIVDRVDNTRRFFQHASGFIVQKMAELQAPVLRPGQFLDRLLKIDFRKTVGNALLIQPTEK